MSKNLGAEIQGCANFQTTTVSVAPSSLQTSLDSAKIAIPVACCFVWMKCFWNQNKSANNLGVYLVTLFFAVLLQFINIDIVLGTTD